jgi:hypothetical protein
MSLLLNWFLSPIEELWCSTTWLMRLNLWTATPLVVSSMEGCWWTLFLWLDHLITLPYLFIYAISNLRAHYPTSNQDVRFWIPISLSVDLYLGGTSCFTKRGQTPRKSSRSQYAKAGIHVRVRWKDVTLSLVLSALYTLLCQGLASFCAKGLTRDEAMWALYYGYITNRVVDRYSTQDELRREEISQGVTRESVDMLLKTVHPLDLF